MEMWLATLCLLLQTTREAKDRRMVVHNSRRKALVGRTISILVRSQRIFMTGDWKKIGWKCFFHYRNETMLSYWVGILDHRRHHHHRHHHQIDNLNKNNDLRPVVDEKHRRNHLNKKIINHHRRRRIWLSRQYYRPPPLLPRQKQGTKPNPRKWWNRYFEVINRSINLCRSKYNCRSIKTNGEIPIASGSNLVRNIFIMIKKGVVCVLLGVKVGARD